MLSVTELQKDRILVSTIDWTMTPEKAVEMYLEWPLVGFYMEY